MTARDNILPDGFTTLDPRNNMINIELLLGKFASAILAGVLVSNEDLASREANMLWGTAVEIIQEHDLWNRNRPLNCSNQMKLIQLFQWKGCREQLGPRVGLKVGVDSVGDIEIKKRYGPLDIRNVDR
jgi:hypothetical protein